MEPRLIRQPSLPLPPSLSAETGHEFRARLFERSPKRNESGELAGSTRNQRDREGLSIKDVRIEGGLPKSRHITLAQ